VTELVFIEQAPSQGMERRIESGATIGRAGCDVILSDPDVSRRHAAIREAGDGVSIEDLGSTNGTYVNGERIDAPRPLRDGDEVKIGSTVWRLRTPAVTRVMETPHADRGATMVTQTPTAPPAAEPAVPERAASAPPPAASAEGRRGDVPVPDFAPSAIRRVVPGPDAVTSFAPEGQQRKKGSAATRVGATIMAVIVVALTTFGVVLYYITEPFK
jgi:predicted component of type VI protein secretion system